MIAYSRLKTISYCKLNLFNSKRCTSWPPTCPSIAFLYPTSCTSHNIFYGNSMWKNSVVIKRLTRLHGGCFTGCSCSKSCNVKSPCPLLLNILQFISYFIHPRT